MSEKRFRLRFSDGDNGEVVNQKGVQLSPRQIVDLLNSLSDENEQLERVISNNLYMLIKLRTENEQLKNRLNAPL